MTKWDRNEWQGRSKRQIINNNKVVDWTIITLIVYFLFKLITKNP